MEIYVKKNLLFPHNFFLVFDHDFMIVIDFTRVALQTQQMITSQIRSRVEYSIQTYNIRAHHLVVKIDEESSLTDGFFKRFNDDA